MTRDAMVEILRRNATARDGESKPVLRVTATLLQSLVARFGPLPDDIRYEAAE
jgi:hypothetical protein